MTSWSDSDSGQMIRIGNDSSIQSAGCNGLSLIVFRRFDNPETFVRTCWDFFRLEALLDEIIPMAKIYA